MELAARAEARQSAAIESDDQPITGLDDRAPDQPGLFDHQPDQLVVGEAARLEALLARSRAFPRKEVGDRAIAGQPAQLLGRERLLEEIAGRDWDVRLRESLPRLSTARSTRPPVKGDRFGHAGLLRNKLIIARVILARSAGELLVISS